MVDVNGDGLPDIIYNDNTYNSPFAYINNGHGWTSDSSWIPPVHISAGGLGTAATIADVNGDGLPDIVWKDPEALMSGAYLNNGHGWFNASSTWTPPVNLSSNGGDNGARVADVNGDGLPDIIYNDNEYGSPYAEINNNSIRANVLVGITYPKGGSSTISYVSAVEDTSSSGTIVNFIPYPVYAVSKITNNDGLGNLSSSTYQYSGGTYYDNPPYDKEFAGFSLVTATDPAGNVTKTYYDTSNGSSSSTGQYNDNFWKIGKPYRVENYDNAGNLYKVTITKWDSYGLGSNAAFVFPDQTLEMDYDGLGTHDDSAESYTWNDANGNQTQKIQWGQVTGSNNGTFTDTGSDEYITNLTYASSIGSNVIGKTSDVTLLNQSSATIKETQYYYDGLALGSVSAGNLTKEADWIAASTYATTQNFYNSYGLITQTLDPRNNTTTYAYDSYNLYLATTTNALSQTTGYQYDYANGQPTQTIDQNNNMFQTSYDGLGRPLQLMESDPNIPATLALKTAYSYTDTLDAVSVAQTDYLSSTSTVTKYSYYDGLGRLIQTRKSTGNSGIYEVTDQVYNALGLVQKKSLPYFSSGSSKATATSTSALFTTYTYDPLQRVLVTTNALGNTSNVYGNWEVTTTDPRGTAKNVYKDAYGNLIQVNEENGSSTYSTYYTYDGLHDLTDLTDVLGNVRNFTYDGLGRRLTAQDLHAPSDGTYGIWNYSYDNAGNLTQTVDPKSQTVNYSYDALNRVSTETYTGGSGTAIAYTYDTCSNGKGLLCAVSSTAVMKNYAYDPLGDIIVTTSTISGAANTFTTQYQYDRQGNKTLITYPNGTEVSYAYNAGGLIQSIQEEPNGGTFANVVSSFSYSPTEQPTVISYANGVTTTNTYNASALYELSNIQTVSSSSVNLQNISYAYDADGNITQKRDTSSTTAANAATYTYDTLNRLTQSQINNGSSTSTVTYAYNALGNITNKSDVGSYLYQGNTGSNYADPDAPTSVNGQTYTYDNDGNLVSGNGMTNTWDYRNRLIQSSNGIATSTYAYDENNNRVEQALATSTTFYPNTLYTLSAAGTGNIGTDYIFAGNELVDTISTGLLQNPTQTIYNSSLSLGWGNWSWSTTVNFNNTSTTYQSSSSIQATYTSAWGAMAIANTSASLASSTELHFAFLSPTANPTLQVDAYVAGGADLGYASVASYLPGGTIDPNTWYVVDIPFSAMGAATTSPTEFAIQDSATGTIYFDGIQATPTNPIYSNYLLPGWNNWSWNSTVNFNAASTVYNGASSSIQVAYTTAWGGLSLENPSSTATSSDGLTFAFLSPTGNPTLQAEAYNASGTLLGYSLLSNYLPSGTIATNTWYAVDIPLANLGATTSTPTDIVLQDGAVGTIYYDDIGFSLNSTSTTTGYINADNLGSTNVVTDQNGNLLQTLDYYPYGGIRVNTGSDVAQRKYIGQQYDAATSLSYLNARYYNSAQGQFISQDPMFLGNPTDQDLEDPQSLNAYSYSEDNPIVKKDPTGKITLTEAVVALGAIEVALAAIEVEAIATNPSYRAAYGASASAKITATLNNISNGLSSIQNSISYTMGLSAPSMSIFPPSTNQGIITDLGQSFGSGAGGLSLPNQGSTIPLGNIVFSDSSQGTSGSTNNQTTINEKSGGFEQAQKDFQGLNPQNVRTYPNGTIVGDLPGGGTANVRENSSDGRPTLEVQNPDGSVEKTRYNP